MSVRGLEPNAGYGLVQRGCGRRRAAALAALRSSLAALGTYLLLSSLPHSAVAADVDIQAAYEVTLAGLAVANANLWLRCAAASIPPGSITGPLEPQGC